MPHPALRIHHVIQPALLCKDLNATMDRLQVLFGMYPSERVDIVDTGVNNAVYALGGMTFLELIEPYDPGCAAMRLLERAGEGWHMVALDIEPSPAEQVEQALARAQVRVVRRNRTEEIVGAWHLHPKDTLGVLIALAQRANPNDNAAWAGKAWREYVGTNTRVVEGLLGVSVVVDDAKKGLRVYSDLGFAFGEPASRDGASVYEARCPRGTVFQLWAPGASGPAASTLARRGPGLFHLLLGTPDLGRAVLRMERHGVAFALRSEDNAWTEPATTFGVPFELKQLPWQSS